MHRVSRTICFMVWFCWCGTAFGFDYRNQALEFRVAALFMRPDDPLTVKLAVDDMVSGKLDGAQTRKAVEALEAELDAMIPAASNETVKLSALKRLLYVAGPWNGELPFAYDQSDPLGKRPENKLLKKYLDSRRGNCVTMPILFMVLGKHIGLNMTLAEAPFHLLVKYTDSAGGVWNLEATSDGGFARDEKYRRDLPMTEKAIDNGIYLRPLTHEETSATIASFLVEHLMRTGQYEDAIVATDALLRQYPRSVHLMVWKGSAYSQILRRDIVTKYQRESDMTPEVRAYADRLYQKNTSAFAEAEALGWTEKDGLK